VDEVKMDEWWVHRMLKAGGLKVHADDRYSLLTKPGRGHDAITWHDRRLREEPGFLQRIHEEAKR
jgi:hypothetical protein